jgi:hypothetical protein
VGALRALSQDLAKSLFTSSVERDERAFIQKAAGRRGANPRTGPRNDNDFAIESINAVPGTLSW